MNTKFFGAFAAVTVAALLATTPSHAFSSLNTLNDVKCSYKDAVTVVCVPAETANKRSKQLFEDKIAPLLKKFGFPGSIRVDHKPAMPFVKAGWGKRKDCGTLPHEAYTGIEKIDRAKVIYCVALQNGYRLPKPKIIAAY